jgi:hypothetical protein
MTNTNALYKEIAEGLADGAINAAFAYMQKQLAVTDGGFAGMFLDSERERVLKDMFVQYINEQIAFDAE